MKDFPHRVSVYAPQPRIMLQWADRNFQYGDWDNSINTRGLVLKVYFVNEEQATMFKLKFGGDYDYLH